MPRSNSSRIKPPALRPGDTLGIIARASSLKRSELDAGCEALRLAGYKPFYFDSILERDLYFAGSLERRIRELAEMFARPDVRAILCARGGSCANYLLQALDVDAIRSRPKLFIGYSDITTLLTYFVDAGGLITFHGPMAAKDWARADGVDAASWQAALGGAAAWGLKLGADSGVSGLIEGAAEGILYGGCLSILVATLGTPYEIKTEGTILFLEDVAAKPFQIDRMLMQLKLAGKLNQVRGIVFGQMKDCVQTVNQGYTLQEVVLRILSPLGIPVAYGLRSGHVTAGNITLPIGVKAALTVQGGQASLKFLGTAVSR